MERVIGIKVDVDTSEGLKDGVPRLLDLFGRYGIHGSFFVPTGKDHTGWTVKRVFTRKGFLKKAGRVGVLSTYGIKTLLYGLLLSGPEFARKNRHLLHAIIEAGHDLGVHGHDHVYWHDHIKDLDRHAAEAILRKSFRVYEELTGTNPISFAAPGWMVSTHALRFFSEKGILFTSNTRGRGPFYPRMAGETYRVLEIPTTLPTLDEVVGIVGLEAPALVDFFLGRLTEGLNIITVHTELEGRRWAGFLESFIRESKAKGFSFVPLSRIASTMIDRGNIPTADVAYGYVDGRAGEVCLQIDPKSRI